MKPANRVGSSIAAFLGTLAISAPWALSQDFLLAPNPIAGNLTEAPGQPPSHLGTFDIVIAPGATLAGNAPALAAFNRAAAQWEAFISDSITVTVNADLAALDPGIIGSASSVTLQAGYDTIRNQMVADAANEIDDGIVAFLPTAAGFSAFVPSGGSLTGFVTLSKANAKALGFSVPDGTFGVSDAAITFSTAFSFDFDNSDGVTPGTMDFETVAAHEIGHALGFFSDVDAADGGETAMQPTTMDLFRFRNGGAGLNPTTTAEFTSFPRDLVSNQNDIFDDLWTEYRMSSGRLTGDGRQASHWKDDDLTGINIGIMDPTLSLGSIFTVGASDLRSLDVIGYEIVSIPEPSSLIISFLAGACLFRRRRPA